MSEIQMLRASLVEVTQYLDDAKQAVRVELGEAEILRNIEAALRVARKALAAERVDGGGA